MSIPLTILPSEREQDMEAIRNFLSGAAELPLTNERDWEETLTAEVDAGRQGLQQNAGDVGMWMRYCYAMALLRDIRYARKTRGELLALGANNSFRQVYEGSKQAVDANLT